MNLKDYNDDKIPLMIFALLISFAIANAKELKLINGVSFENWAAASAHSTRGMSDKDIAKTLGVKLSA